MLLNYTSKLCSIMIMIIRWFLADWLAKISLFLFFGFNQQQDIFEPVKLSPSTTVTEQPLPLPANSHRQTSPPLCDPWKNLVCLHSYWVVRPPYYLLWWGLITWPPKLSQNLAIFALQQTAFCALSLDPTVF